MITQVAFFIELEALFRAVGLIGFCIYVAAFLALCAGRLDSSGVFYFGLVFAASCSVLLSLSVDFNLSAALIQGFYVVMSLGAIISRLLKSPRRMDATGRKIEKRTHASDVGR